MQTNGLIALRKRADYLKAAASMRRSTPGFVLQIRNRGEDEPESIRVGITCSKKVGNAVARNLAKRRLREVARLVLPEHGRNGFDYVLIGRRQETASRDFAAMLEDLRHALAEVHK
ncbi:MAG: ribonuclease P protein component [Boseongicola sp. SB0676_bin_33]|nr:ribonuclease P protein component [Boseongicola sp. SB0676_bin_33]MYK30759.1 ribonuclease P protein component [Boseongicola sp. SB0670_bin_30]